ncbi:MAG: hypothetical protein ACRD15_10935 [Vicinamibacterales bacterium]
MLDELQRRNYAKTTVQYYIQAVERFRQTFSPSARPAQSQTHLREYRTTPAAAPNGGVCRHARGWKPLQRRHEREIARGTAGAARG